MASQPSELLKKHAQKSRFVIVGGANTALDFGILFLLTFLGLDKIPSNYISTSVSLIFSFFVNKSFTFKSEGGNKKRQFVSFLIITLVGLWVLQPVIIYGFDILAADIISSEAVRLFVGKLLATVVTLIWNYILYARVVFKK